MLMQERRMQMLKENRAREARIVAGLPSDSPEREKEEANAKAKVEQDTVMEDTQSEKDDDNNFGSK